MPHAATINRLACVTFALAVACQASSAGQALEGVLHPAARDTSAVQISTFGFPAIAETGAPVTGELLAPFELTKQVRPMVEQMARTSPTFRRQCTRLSAASVSVLVRLDERMDRTRMNARTTIDVRDGRVWSVETRLGLLAPQYLAHEVEHVLEQIDGVDLRWACANGVHGAYESSPGMFETARAIAAGRLVDQEMGRARDE